MTEAHRSAENQTPTKLVDCPVCQGARVVTGTTGNETACTVYAATCCRCMGTGKVEAVIIQ